MTELQNNSYSEYNDQKLYSEYNDQNQRGRIMEQSESNQYFMDMFLEYFNNFATYEYFAEYFALDVDQARSIIDHGRKLYQAQFD